MGFELCVLRILKDLFDTVPNCPIDSKVDHWLTPALVPKIPDPLVAQLGLKQHELDVILSLAEMFCNFRMMG